MPGGVERGEISYVVGNRLLGKIQDTGLAGVYYRKWIGIINDVLESVDVSRNTFLWLPSSGGYYDQNTDIMNIWIMVKQEYMKFLRNVAFVEQMKKESGKNG